MDAVSEQRLALVCPALAAKIRQMADILLEQDIQLRVTQGLRSWNEQAKLYEQGRTTPGKIVTNAAPGHSWHNFGLACDCLPLGAVGVDWNSSHPQWKLMEDIGSSLGLTVGAKFRTFPDAPHFQLEGKLSVSPDEETRQIFTQGGMLAVWEAAGFSISPVLQAKTGESGGV